MVQHWFSTRRFWFAIAGTGLVWALAATLLVPALIEAIHSGQLGFLAPLIPGRESVPVSRYLADWAGLARSVSFVLTTAVLLLAVVRLILVHRTGGLSGGPVRDPSVRDVLLTALWFGLMTGLGEAYYAAGKVFFVHETVPEFRPAGPNTMWMAPLGDAAWFLLAGLLLLPVLALLRRRAGTPGVADRALTGSLAFLALLSLLMITDRIHLWSAALLATGLAMFLSKSRALSLEVRRAALPRRVLQLALVPLALFIVVRGWEILRERNAFNGSRPAAASPNVLLLVLDTQRAQSMSLYGYSRPTTPRLSQLAADGVVFDRAVSTAPWTLPSHASMLTGRYNHELKTGWTEPLDGRFLTLAEVLGARGYRTGGFVGNTIFCNRFYGIDQGFGRYLDEAKTPAGVVMSTWLGRSFLTWLRKQFDDYRILGRRWAPTINAEFLAWLGESPQDRPFFAFLNYFDVHGPYLPPAPYDRAFARDGSRYWLEGAKSEAYSPARIQELIDRYDGGTAYADAQLGALMDALRDRKLLDNTIVIIVGDHGEQFGEHGRMGHANHLYLPEVWVPLVIRYPARVPSGLRVAGSVSAREIPATVLDLTGVGTGSLPGVSLARHWTDSSAMAPDTILTEFEGLRAILTGDYQLIRAGKDKFELYDLKSDPGQARNLAADRPKEVVALREALERMMAAPAGEDALVLAAGATPALR